MVYLKRTDIITIIVYNFVTAFVLFFWVMDSRKPRTWAELISRIRFRTPPHRRSIWLDRLITVLPAIWKAGMEADKDQYRSCVCRNGRRCAISAILAHLLYDIVRPVTGRWCRVQHQRCLHLRLRRSVCLFNTVHLTDVRPVGLQGGPKSEAANSWP